MNRNRHIQQYYTHRIDVFAVKKENYTKYTFCILKKKNNLNKFSMLILSETIPKMVINALEMLNSLSHEREKKKVQKIIQSIE